MKRLYLACVFAVATLAAGCSTTQLEKIQTWSTNYQAAVVSINAAIASSAPLVAKSCGDLQTLAMLIGPYLPTNAKAPKYFAAANAALNAYCQTVPTDIKSTIADLAAAIAAAKTGYYSVGGTQ